MGVPMKNFQAMIDAAFGLSTNASHEPQLPSHAAQERDRAFAERASKIEALRQKRLKSPAIPPERLSFEIVRHRGYWRTRYAGRHSSPFSDQAAAILAAKKLARKKRDLGHRVEVILRRTDGVAVPQSIDDDGCTPRVE
jgi:hypothetical protein